MVYIYHFYICNMSSNMFESETWGLIDQYLAMLQQLGSQSQHIATTQNEVYVKLADLIHTMRSPPPPPWLRVRPSAGTHSIPRSTHNARVSAARRRPRESSDNIERGAASSSGRAQSRTPSTRTQNVSPLHVQPLRPLAEEAVGVEQSQTTSTVPPDATSTANTSEMEHLSPPTSLFGSIGTTPPQTSNPFVPTTTPFTNFIHELHWTLPQSHQQDTPHPIHMRPFNFMDNVPVFPTSEEIAAATRIIPFGSVEAPNNAQCPITLVPFEPSELVMQIVHCSHLFDVVHLNGWFRDNVRCPVCRHDIRETGVGDDTPSALAPEPFVEDGNDTDPDMPALELEDTPVTSLGADPISSDMPPTPPPRQIPYNPSTSFHSSIGSLMGLQNIGMAEDTIRTPPVWSFNQIHPASTSNDANPPLTRIFSEMQSAMATQGLDLLSNAITQSIRESFPPTTPVSDTTPAPPDNNGSLP
jgi:hypothetical protein